PPPPRPAPPPRTPLLPPVPQPHRVKAYVPKTQPNHPAPTGNPRPRNLPSHPRRLPILRLEQPAQRHRYRGKSFRIDVSGDVLRNPFSRLSVSKRKATRSGAGAHCNIAPNTI